MSGISVRPAIGKLQNPNKDLRDTHFVTGQNIGSNRKALDVLAMGLSLFAEDLTVEVGSDENLVVITGHNAKIGDVLSIGTTANSINETEVVIDEIVGPNSFRLGTILSAALQAGDIVSILRPISPRYTADGAGIIYSSNYQYNFLRNGVSQQVVEDTVDPNNNRPLPVKLMGINGTLQLTTDNLDISSDHTEDSMAIGDGTNLLEITADGEAKTKDQGIVDITGTHDTAAGTKGVQLMGQRADFATIDSGSGTGVEGDAKKILTDELGQIRNFDQYTYDEITQLRANLIAMSAKLPSSLGQKSQALSLSTTMSAEDKAKLDIIANGTDGLAGLVASLLNLDYSTEAKQDAIIVILNSILADLQNKADLIDTQPVSAASLPLPAGAASAANQNSIITELVSLNTKVTSTNTKLDSLETALTPEFSNHQTQPVVGSTTFTMPVGARRMVIQNSLESGAPIRFVPAAATPTASNGFYLGVGQSTSEMAAGSFKAISVDGSSADVTVLWSV